MKRCPTCNRNFEDNNLSFCLDDGTPLATVPEQEETVVSSSSRHGSEPPPTEQYVPRDWNSPAYQPPRSDVPPVKTRRRVWPWVLGIGLALLLGLVGLGIVAAVMLPRMLSPNSNRSTVSANVRSETENSNLNANEGNSNSGAEVSNSNSASASNESTPPTDEAEVLSTLTDLEHEWTVANINADKKKLDEILAEDYVGTDLDGKVIGKTEYIRTIERDTVTQDWSFDDLKVVLRGDRATLTGTVKFVARGNEIAFRFTDKFIWRDGRWQAIGSEISRVEGPGSGPPPTTL